MDAPLEAFYFRDFKNSYIPNILKELYQDRVYAPFFEGKKDMMVVDVGANIGLFTYYAYPYAKKIVSLEPSERHFEALTAMLAQNKMERVMPLKLALSKENGEADFYHHPNVTMYSLRPEVNAIPKDKERVITMEFATLCTTYDLDSIDFMKLDVEGAEYDIISSEAFEKMAPRIKAMVLELHEWSGVNYNQIIMALNDYGFTTRQIPSDATIFSAVRV